MGLIRNILAIIGLLSIVGAGFAWMQFGDKASNLSGEIAALEALDPKAESIYTEMWEKLKASGNSAEATVWKVPLEEDVSPEDAEEAMKSVANEHNIKAVGELPLSEQVASMTGEEQRLLKIYQYCDPLTAKKMVDYSDAFAAYLPCRIAMVEDKEGNVNLFALNMDLMIYGGKTLPDELKKEAERVKTIMLDIMNRGAAGEF